MFIERIQRFKTNENACEQGVSFLGENRSVWDSVTQCLAAKRSSAITESVSETIIIADDDPTKQSVVAFSLAKDVMLQQILFKGKQTRRRARPSPSSLFVGVSRRRRDGHGLQLVGQFGHQNDEGG